MLKYNYLVKIINPKKKSEFEVQSLKSKQKFLSLVDLKQQILLDHKEKVPNLLSVIGYIQPGHGLSGKKKWLTSDSDLDDMYGTCTVKHDIMLCCHGSTTCPEPVRGSKRSQSVRADNAPRKTSRYDTHVDRMAEVQEIEDELREKHRESRKYTDEQLRSWAHLIQLKKHSSLDEPPDKPFFRSSRKRPVLQVPQQCPQENG